MMGADTAFHADQVAKLLQDSGSSVLFTDSKHLEVAKEAINAKPKDGNNSFDVR